MFIVSLGLLFDSKYEDLVSSSPSGVVSTRAKQVYTIASRTATITSSPTQTIYQPFTSPRLLSIQFNVCKFINRLIYGTRRYQELFPPITKIANFNNTKPIAEYKKSHELDGASLPLPTTTTTNYNHQGKSNFPINCAVDDLDLMFDGGDQITIFDSAIDDLHHIHPQYCHGHNMGYPDSSFHEKGGFEEERNTPVFQQQKQQEKEQQQHKVTQEANRVQQPLQIQNKYHSDSQKSQRVSKQAQIAQSSSLTNDLPIFDDFLEAHQHHYTSNNDNNNNNANIDNTFNWNPFNDKEAGKESNKNTFASLAPRAVLDNQSPASLSRNEKYYGDYEVGQDRFDYYPYFDDFKHQNPSPTKSMIKDQGKGSPRHLINGKPVRRTSESASINAIQYRHPSSVENALISSSVSSTESFLSPLDDEIFSRIHRQSPPSGVVVSEGYGVNYQFEYSYHQTTDNDDENNLEAYASEVESSLASRDSALSRPYSHSISLPHSHSHSHSRFQSHVPVNVRVHSNSVGEFRNSQYYNDHYHTRHHHNHLPPPPPPPQQQQQQQQQHHHQQQRHQYHESFKLPTNVRFGARQVDESVITNRKRKLSSSGISVTSPSISSFDSDIPLSPTDTLMKKPLKRDTSEFKHKPKKSKKINKDKNPTYDDEGVDVNVEDDNNKDAKHDITDEPVIITTTTKTINTTVRKLSYAGKDGKIGHTFECPHCNSEFKVKGYLTRHLKKHSSSKAFHCPFFQESSAGSSATAAGASAPPASASSPLSVSLGTKCHPTGGFSRRDTFKTHLKALHFIYPPGTKSNERNLLSGRCAGCFQFFENNNQWLTQHIETGLCQGTVVYKEKLRQLIVDGRSVKKVVSGSGSDEDEEEEGEVGGNYLVQSENEEEFGKDNEEVEEEDDEEEWKWVMKNKKQVTVKTEPVD
ncbi:STP3 [Candida margitis]|uniref:STP3 n=1 Tax=Candida margitis TaxID=1775924 RepID=UPI002226C1AC|nr:STP3 [Candida margitis]KAI5969558.1 STP3 [Candida margitis]